MNIKKAKAAEGTPDHPAIRDTLLAGTQVKPLVEELGLSRPRVLTKFAYPHPLYIVFGEHPQHGEVAVKITAHASQFGEGPVVAAINAQADRLNRRRPMVDIYGFGDNRTLCEGRIEWLMTKLMRDPWRTMESFIYNDPSYPWRSGPFFASLPTMADVHGLGVEKGQIQTPLNGKSVNERLLPHFESIEDDLVKQGFLTESERQKYRRNLGELDRDFSTVILGDFAPLNLWFRAPHLEGAVEWERVGEVKAFDPYGFVYGPLESDVAQAAVNFGGHMHSQQLVREGLERLPKDLYNPALIGLYLCHFLMLSGGYRVRDVRKLERELNVATSSENQQALKQRIEDKKAEVREWLELPREMGCFNELLTVDDVAKGHKRLEGMFCLGRSESWSNARDNIAYGVTATPNGTLPMLAR